MLDQQYYISIPKNLVEKAGMNSRAIEATQEDSNVYYWGHGYQEPNVYPARELSIEQDKEAIAKKLSAKGVEGITVYTSEEWSQNQSK